MRQYSGRWSLSQLAQAISDQNWPGQPPQQVEYLVVGGGGSGGGSIGGGGGAGGLLAGFTGITIGSPITVTIGSGGAAKQSTSGASPGNIGLDSVFGNITAKGGGGGGSYLNTGVNDSSSGGSGGGGASLDSGVLPGAQGISGQGNQGGNGKYGTNPWCGGGGGGAGTIGISSSGYVAGSGGAGIASDISGTRFVYAGGGGGSGHYTNGVGGAGGVGGGGRGAISGGATGGSGSTTADSGGINTGGGGGAGAFNTGVTSGAGGSGVVIISYPDTFRAAASTTGSPTVSTSGSGSISFNGSTQYASVTTPALGSGDFTIEFWLYLNSVSQTFYYDGRGAGSSGLQPTVYYSAGLKYFTNGGDRINGDALSTGQWYHIAVSRVSGNTRMFINGTQTGSTYVDSNTYVASTTGSGWIAGSSAFFTNGYMTNLRIVVGTGLYSSSFPVPTAPLTSISGTQLLMSAVSGSVFLDSSPSARTVSTFGTPTWNQLSPFATGGGYKNRVYTWTSSGSITF